jgi:hypothetical protein
MSKFGLVMFVVYSIMFEMIVWGLFGWAVFVCGRSGWWLLFALALSSRQLKAESFHTKGQP